MPLVSMATPFQLGGSRMQLLSTSSEYELATQNNTRHLNSRHRILNKRKYIFIFKLVELALIAVSLTLFLFGNDLVDKQIHLAMTYVTFGAVFTFASITLINPAFCSSTTMVLLNMIATLSLLTIGAMSVANWWQIQQHIALPNIKMKIDANSMADIEISSEFKAFSGMFCIFCGLLYLVESILILIWDYTTNT